MVGTRTKTFGPLFSKEQKLKIGTFIKIICDTFLPGIIEHLELEKLKNNNYRFIKNKEKFKVFLIWFSSDKDKSSKLIDQIINNKTDSYINKIFNKNIQEKDITKNEAKIIKAYFDKSGFETMADSVNIEKTSIKNMIETLKKYDVFVREKKYIDDISNIYFKLLDEKINKNNSLKIKNVKFLGNNSFVLQNKIFILPSSLKFSNEIQENEKIYINELFNAYTDDYKKEITLNNINMFNKYKENLNACREDFYNAEYVFYQIRDLFEDGQLEFNNLKSEILDSIKFQISVPYKNGFIRLIKCAEYISNSVLSKSYLAIPNKISLIGQSEKRGVLHMLVNDKKIVWVRKDIDENI